jgi:hypothetical protein
MSGLVPTAKVVRPGASQGGQGDALRLPTAVVSEIDHVIYVDLV